MPRRYNKPVSPTTNFFITSTTAAFTTDDLRQDKSLRDELYFIPTLQHFHETEKNVTLLDFLPALAKQFQLCLLSLPPSSRTNSRLGRNVLESVSACRPPEHKTSGIR